MHAVSPQLMVWDPSSLGMQMHSPEIQHPMLAPTAYPVVVPSQPYLPQDSIPHIYASTAIPNPQELQNVVWIQTPTNLLPQEENDTNTVMLSQPFPSGGLTLHNGHQGVYPVLMNVNGQRLLVNHPVHHLPSTQPTMRQVMTEPHSHEGVHLVNFNNVNRNPQQMRSVPQEFRPTLAMTSFQDNQPNAYSRPRLTPKRRNGNVISACDTAASWRNFSDGRTLSGMNTAQRRRSQSADEENNEVINQSCLGSPSPNKRLASTVSNLEKGCSLLKSPDSRLLRKLTDIIEYYFSDECLTRNGYMLKQLSNGDCDGYISIRRVAALKRVKAQTRDLRTVSYAVGQSTKLELDKEGMMIRRKRPLPENIEAPRFIRSVLAINLPTESPTVEDVTSLFKPYGELTLVRVLRPGKEIPPYLKDYTAWVADLGTRVCAVIEFENQDEAQKACREINMQNRGQNCLRVALLKPGARIRRTLYRKYKDEHAEGQAEEANEYADHSSPTTTEVKSTSPRERHTSDSSSDDNPPNKSIVAENNKMPNNENEPILHYDASASGSDTGSDIDGDRTKLDSNQFSDTCDGQRKTSPDSGYSHTSSSEEIESTQSSPLITRKTNLGKSEETLQAQFSHPTEKKFIDGVPVGASRQPKGPDSDNIGFTQNRPPQN